jgi:hypothetical protein
MVTLKSDAISKVTLILSNYMHIIPSILRMFVDKDEDM